MNRIVFFMIAAVMCYGECWAKVTPVHEYLQSKISDDTKAPCFNYPLSSCPANGVCTKCPVGKKYLLKNCNSPYVKVGDSCSCPLISVTLQYSNDKCLQTCDGKCIKKSCTPSPNQSGCTNGTKKCDNGCGSKTRVCCNACKDLVTTKPNNSSYTYTSCTDGDGSKQIKNGWQCDNGYYKVGSVCEKICNTNPCSGYTLTSCPVGKLCSECSVVNSDCSSGGKKYKITGCTAVACAGYTLTSCPAGKVCSECGVVNSDCSSGGKKYKITGCAVEACSGYTLASCPAGKLCSECSVVNSDCSSGGKKYKVTGCAVEACSDYTLASCPAGTICESCEKINSDCSSGGVLQKATGCKVNWADTQSYWCAVPQTTDCTALGYTHTSGSCDGDYTKIGCPFDKTKFACIELY